MILGIHAMVLFFFENWGWVFALCARCHITHYRQIALKEYENRGESGNKPLPVLQSQPWRDMKTKSEVLRS